MRVIRSGLPRPLGATWSKQGVNFAVFSSNATRVEVVVYDPVTGFASWNYNGCAAVIQL